MNLMDVPQWLEVTRAIGLGFGPLLTFATVLIAEAEALRQKLSAR